MSVFRVAHTRRELDLIAAGYERAVRGMHIERARISPAYLRPVLLRIARDANHRMIAAMRAASAAA